MRSGMSYIKDTNDFLLKLKKLKKVLDNTILVDVVRLYPSIPQNEGLEVLKKQFDNLYEKSIPTDNLAKMAEFVLKNNFEFDSNVKHQMSGTATGTKISPPYGCIYMDYMENQVMVVVVALKMRIWQTSNQQNNYTNQLLENFEK